MKRICFLLSMMTCSVALNAQDIKPFTPTGEALYYNFWVGNWHKVRKDDHDTKVQFRVSKSINPAAFYEDWDMQIDSVTTIHAVALRAWDKTNSKWMYTWVSDNGLYQVWEGKKVGENWYLFKEFTINGVTYLSRQEWIPDRENKLIRISERSDDQGKTWKLRFKENFI